MPMQKQPRQRATSLAEAPPCGVQSKKTRRGKQPTRVVQERIKFPQFPVSSDEEDDCSDCSDSCGVYNIRLTVRDERDEMRERRRKTYRVSYSVLEPFEVLRERVAGVCGRPADTFVLKDAGTDRLAGAYEMWWVRDGFALAIVDVAGNASQDAQ